VGTALTQIGPLAQRSIKRTLRSPPLLATGLFFPLVLFAFVIGGLGKTATQIPGFPTTSYTTFAIGILIAFTALNAITVAGLQLGEDVQTGFVRRLSLTRLGAMTLLAGQLAGVVVFVVVQVLLFLLAVFNAVALASVGMALALRTGSGLAVQAAFPVFMALLFLASMNLPRDLINAGWFRTVTTFNPASYLIEAPRSLLVSGWDAQALELGVLVVGSIMAVALTTTAAGLRGLSVRR
jgi:ABC-2 type transport system permease protein